MTCTPPYLDETVSASAGKSPGIVEDHELLARRMALPQDVDARTMTPAKHGIRVTDLLCDGWSVDRCSHTSKAAVAQRLAKISKADERKLWVLCVVQIRSLRGAREEPLACVIDNIDPGDPDNTSHASILLSAAAREGLEKTSGHANVITQRAQAMKLRNELSSFFMDGHAMVSLEDAFD